MRTLTSFPGHFLLLILFSSCVSTATRGQDECAFPERGANSDAVLGAILPGCKLTGLTQYIPGRGEGKDFAEIYFLKSAPEDQIPGQVAVYRKDGEALKLAYVAPLPVPIGGCRKGECSVPARFGLARAPDHLGFQLSTVTKGEIKARGSYQFHWDGSDFQLTLLIQSVDNGPPDADGKIKFCSRSYRYDRGTRVDRTESGESSTSLSAEELKPRYLKKDHVSFEAPDRSRVCSSPKG